MRKYVINYDQEKKLFSLWDEESNLVGQDVNGRELGRDAWRAGADEVSYRYDLGLDETMPLIPYWKKYSVR